MVSDDIKYLPENEVVKEVYKNADGVFRVIFKVYQESLGNRPDFFLGKLKKIYLNDKGRITSTYTKQINKKYLFGDEYGNFNT